MGVPVNAVLDAWDAVTALGLVLRARFIWTMVLLTLIQRYVSVVDFVLMIAPKILFLWFRLFPMFGLLVPVRTRVLSL